MHCIIKKSRLFNHRRGEKYCIMRIESVVEKEKTKQVPLEFDL